MQRGTAPVALHDITHAAATDAGGIRPRPLVAGQTAMLCTPVVVAVHDDGRTLQLLPSSWILAPHVSANSDPEKQTADGSALVPVGPEQPARLVLHVHLPRGVRLVFKTEEDAEREILFAEIAKQVSTQDLAGVLWSTDPTNPTLDELEKQDPDIWKVDPDRLMSSLHANNSRPSIYQVKEGE